MRAKALVAARIGLLLVLAVSAWRANNYYSEREPGPDSSLFMSIAWHAAHGRALYKGVWEQKPPLIFALDAAALTVGGDGANSVRTMERWFAVLGVAGLFTAAFLAFERFWIAWIASALYLIHLFRPTVIEDGNVTEEYGAVFLLACAAGAIAASKSTGRRGLIFVAASGAAFALAVLCKEPFLLIAAPWFVHVTWPREGNWRESRTKATAFVTAAAVPVVAFLAYLLANGAVKAWLDTVAFSLAYTANGPEPHATASLVRLFIGMKAKVTPMLLASATALIGLVGLSRWRIVRARDGIPLAIAASTLLSLVATSLGGRYYGHYYIFFVPPLALLCAWGMSLTREMVSHSRRLSIAASAAGVLLVLADAQSIKAFASNLAAPARSWDGHWLAELIRKNTSVNDAIWTPWAPLLYVETDRLAPTKWLAAFDAAFIDTPGSTAADKYRALQADLITDPPRVIVVGPLAGNGPTRLPAERFLEKSGLAPWIAANYTGALCSGHGNWDLLVRNAAPLLGPTPVASDSVAMYVGLASLYEQGDPTQALACFRMILARTPTHYGARFQLAKTLDTLGLTAEATKEWQTVLRLAREAKDQVTEGVALARLR